MATMRWLEAVLLILKDRGEPVHYADLAEEILKRGLVKTKTATPANTVYTTCLEEMRTEQPQVARVGKGLFAIVEPKSGGGKVVKVEPGLPTENSWIQATGVLWRRDWVHWSGTPRLLGIAPSGNRQVDFCDERGLYILYDGARPVYVGRSVDRPLGKRLLDHTTDRLGARWDRFSWFGLRAVTEDGRLADPPVAHCTSEIFIGDLEAVLIEALEPPLNRRRGDDIEAKEFRQYRDDSKDRQKMVRAFEDFMKTGGPVE